MSSNEHVVEICSSDDENNCNTINNNRSSKYKYQPLSSLMASQSILDGYENSSTSLFASQPQTNSSHALSLVSQPETNRKLQITVKDNAKSIQVKSTKIVVEIDEGMSSQENREANRARASKMRLYGFEHKDEDFTEQFLQLLELCLKYEFSDGMMRILNKSIIPLYKSADENYIESMEFQKFLEGIINRIIKQPYRKFSALKDLCDTLKNIQTEKRVYFDLLKECVTEKRKTKLTNPMESPKKPRIVDVIDLDQFYESTVIDFDTHPKSTISDDVIIIDDEQKNCSDSNKMKSETISDEQKKVLALIKHLEVQIEYHKNEIKKYDEMEVCSDSVQSPYILSDTHKIEILRLYKKICDLSGQSSVTRRAKRVKLRVKEGHPSGPAKKLEDWLKKNAQDGDPPFPDFMDVVKCVSDAIAEESLSWSKEQILSEARMLFIECGRALQKRRQKREYRDLVSKVKNLDVYKDPADDDPLLLKKLEENKTIANLKEAAIIEKYSQMKTHNRTKVNKKIVVLQKVPTTVGSNAQQTNLNTTNSVSKNNGDFSFEVPVVAVANIGISQPEIKDSQDTEVDVKPAIVPLPIDSSIEIICSDSDDYSSSENEASNFELDDVVPEKNALINAGQSTSSTNDFAQSIVITNVISESVPQNICTEVVRESTLQASNYANISDQVTEINSTLTLQNDNSIPTEANTNEPTFVMTNFVSESTLQKIPADDTNIISDQITTTNSNLIENYNYVILKTEPGPSTADDTLKMMLEFEENCSINGISMKTTIFDFDQEPIVCIEISSSESESDLDDENGIDDDDHYAVNNENCHTNDQCGEKKDIFF